MNMMNENIETRLREAVLSIKMATDFYVSTMIKVTPDQLGLDKRSGKVLHICVEDGTIAVKASDDKKLRYHGDFDYVYDKNRWQYGDYVIYSADDEIVRRHLKYYQDTQVQAA
jgi:hypothetical protein